MVPIKIFFAAAFAGILIAGGSAVGAGYLWADEAASPVSSSDLIEKAKDYDGMGVLYSGEVIGDIMDRGDYSWINVSDGNNAIGVWIPSEDAEKIQYAGRYGIKGDIVEIAGIFNRACPEHGGDLDIHSTAMEIVKKGYVIKRDINLSLVLAGSILFIIAACMNFIIFRKRL